MWGKRIITLLDQCTSTEIIWPEGQQKFIGKITFSETKTSCKAALKYLCWVFKPGWKFLKDSRVKHTPCLIISILPCYLMPATLWTLLCYYWACCTVPYWFRRHFDSQWLIHSIILFKRNTMWLSLQQQHILSGWYGTHCKIYILHKECVPAMRIHISCLKLHESFSSVKGIRKCTCKHSEVQEMPRNLISKRVYLHRNVNMQNDCWARTMQEKNFQKGGQRGWDEHIVWKIHLAW